jgi:Autophagy receptor zinc finger-C2H2 domain
MDYLYQIRDLLKQQQQSLRNGLDQVASHFNGVAINESMQLSMQTWICPMCGLSFSKHVMSSDDFHMHVTSHFTNEQNNS